MSDPRQELRRQVWASAAAAIGLCAVATVWTALPRALPAPVTTASGASVEGAAHAVTPVSAAVWNLTLWQPLSDAPVVVAAAAPLPIKLFSILHQGERLIAAIDPGDGSALVYASSGDTVRDATITAVDDKGVTVRYAGASQRLELSQ